MKHSGSRGISVCMEGRDPGSDRTALSYDLPPVLQISLPLGAVYGLFIPSPCTAIAWMQKNAHTAGNVKRCVKWASRCGKHLTAGNVSAAATVFAAAVLALWILHGKTKGCNGEMTSEFAIAVHALVFLNHKGETLSSDALADNVCTNPARVRKVMAPEIRRSGGEPGRA